MHTLDRRGRGGSGPQGPGYSSEREREDIGAVRAATGAEFIVGHSFGGFLALEAMAAGQRYQRAALYEARRDPRRARPGHPGLERPVPTGAG